MKIKRIDNKGQEKYYRDLNEASKEIDSNLDSWKIQLFIQDAINNNKVAFKYRWAIEK